MEARNTLFEIYTLVWYIFSENKPPPSNIRGMP